MGFSLIEDAPRGKFSVVEDVPQETGLGGRITGTAKNLGMGAIKGASDIGATLLSPLDATGITGMSNADRRVALKQFFAENADPESFAFKTGDVAAGIAGTAGAGGVLGKAVTKAVPYAGAAGQTLSKLGSAIESGGFSLGGQAGRNAIEKTANAALRGAGGAISGAATAGLINPEDADVGAALGAAIPAVGKVVMTAGNALGKAMSVSPEVAALAQKAEAMGVTIPADRLVNSPALNAASASLRYIPFSGRAGTERAMESQLNKALSRTFGQDTDNVTMALRDARAQLGGEFDRTLKSNVVNVDRQLLDDLSANLKRAKRELSESDYRIVENQIDDLLSKAKGFQIDGNAAYNVKKSLDSIGGRGSNEAAYARDVKKSLMQALERSLGAHDAAAFATTRKQYGNMKEIERLAKNGAEGEISAARLANIKGVRDQELQDVIDVAAQFVKQREGQHGAAQRVGLGSMATLFGGLTGTLPAVGGAMVGANALNRILNSDAARRALLSNSASQGANMLTNILENPALRAYPAVLSAD